MRIESVFHVLSNNYGRKRSQCPRRRRNLGFGMSGQVIVHTSHFCQIGVLDQGLLRMMEEGN
jgi:hypothetical protein